MLGPGPLRGPGPGDSRPSGRRPQITDEGLDRMSFKARPAWLLSFRTAVAIAALCALVAGTTASTAASGASSNAPQASAAKTAMCTAMIQKGKKLVAVYEKVYKYKFVKVKGSK